MKQFNNIKVSVIKNVISIKYMERVRWADKQMIIYMSNFAIIPRIFDLFDMKWGKDE